MSTSSQPHEAGPDRRKIIGICILLALLGATIAVSFWPTKRVIVRNASDGELKALTLELRTIQGDWNVTKTVASLNAGESFAVRHSKNELRANLRFEVSGQQFAYEQDHIDLWQADGWALEIQKDGSVKGGYGQ